MGKTNSVRFISNTIRSLPMLKDKDVANSGLKNVAFLYTNVIVVANFHQHGLKRTVFPIGKSIPNSSGGVSARYAS